MSSEFIPLSVPCFRGNEKKYVDEAIETEWVSTAGSYVGKFEQDIVEKLGSKFAVPTVNGTSALHISLIHSGVSTNDEVLVPTLTFIAPVNTIKYVGANPVFMDCDDYLNIDIQQVTDFIETQCEFNGEFLVNKKTKRFIKAIIPVHVFGHPVDLDKLMPLARKYNISVIEDATESLGSYYKSGTYENIKTGVIGDYGTLSFNGNKIITTGGGGMILTNDKSAYEKMKYLTCQAKDDEVYYVHDEVGYNYRMTNLQAALGVSQLEQLDKFIEIKRKNYNTYKEMLSGVEGLSFIDEPAYSFSNMWFYSLVVDEGVFGQSRDDIISKLSKNRIQARPIWKLNHHQKPYLENQSYKIEKAEYYYKRVVNLPCSISLTDDDIARVVSSITNK